MPSFSTERKHKMKQPKITQNLGELPPALLHEYVERQVALRPDHVAVECGGEAWTYSKLNQRATQLAGLLQAHGIGRGSLVGLCASKSCHTFAAILGALKAGAAYVPLDPKFPLKRIEAIIRDAAVSLVLCDGAIAPHLSTLGVATIDPKEASSVGSVLFEKPSALSSNDLCYVIYTSGSTGTPKGVLIEAPSCGELCQCAQKRVQNRLRRQDLSRVFVGIRCLGRGDLGGILSWWNLGGGG